MKWRKLKRNGESLTDQLSESSDKARQEVFAYRDALVNHIKKKPFKSVILASAIGLLVGKFLI
jgi:ElaB/YqjD/DUF883 family membrane-anchored ribosome-binding protein